jgi:hypothetical protein
MFWYLAILGVTAAAVAAYNRLRRRDPTAADALVHTLTQTSSLVVVLAQAALTALDALRRPNRPVLVSVGHTHGFLPEDLDDEL